MRFIVTHTRKQIDSDGVIIYKSNKNICGLMIPEYIGLYNHNSSEITTTITLFI